MVETSSTADSSSPPVRRLPAPLRNLASSARTYVGTLLFLPLLIVLFGARWTWERPVLPNAVTRVDPERGGQTPETRRFWLYDDGTSWERGIVLPRGGYLELELPVPLQTFTLTMQANFDESYGIQGAGDDARFVELWKAAGSQGDRTLRTRSSPYIRTGTPIRLVRVYPVEGQDRFSVSWMSFQRPALVFYHWLLIPVIWGLWLLVALAPRVLPSARPVSDRVLASWRRLDLVAAATLSYLVLFQVPAGVLVFLLLFGLLLLTVHLVRRAPVPALLTIVVVVLGVGYIIPRAVTRLVVSRISQFYELNVDHRMRPYVMDDINGDGIRFKGEATDLKDDDFVILFLGDSFTYGFRLEYDEAYPSQVEQLLHSGGCPENVRVVNFGWTGSSPLLSLRLVKEIGYRYKPDLLVYNLDMTDFGDDLRYERELRQGGDLQPDVMEVFHKLLAMYMPALVSNLGDLAALNSFIGLRSHSDRYSNSQLESPSGTVAGDKFFATNYPLEQTRALFEEGVMKNLAALHTFSTEVLDAPMILVVYPRGYQYSLEESPNNNEKGLYTVLGPYVKEPFRYFGEVAERLPYPVYNLLDDFESAREFPLYFDDDPHWTRAGAAVAARGVVHRLSTSGLLPCTVDTP